ncbi:MAG: hypothetical protein J6A08_10070 [Lachnospiraceae bacterium]|nr:hypothetical protein [Lachnospiraceae bacterium]
MKKSTTRFTKEESKGDSMPTVENVNYEMFDYLKQIKEYISDFKKLPKEEAQKKAHKNLMDAGIVDAKGDLTGFYKQ